MADWHAWLKCILWIIQGPLRTYIRFFLGQFKICSFVLGIREPFAGLGPPFKIDVKLAVDAIENNDILKVTEAGILKNI